jgi:sec-independent protein translocase protein TatC
MGEPRHRLPDESERDGDLSSGKMGFLEHLDELRTRLIYSCIAIGAGMVVSFLFVDRLADFVLAAAVGTLPAEAGLITTRPGEGLSFYLDLALMGGVILAAPLVSYQVWRFVAPGLYAREKRLVVPFVAVAMAGTLAGAAFSHYVLFPSMMAFFGTFGSPRIRFMPRLEDTFDLYRNTLIGMVAVFQIPTLVFFLARMRLVTAAFLWRHIKYAVLAIFIVAAVLTPSADPWNQAVFAAPMLGLYVISIGLAWLVAPGQPVPSRDDTAPGLRLVFAAAVLDQARRQRFVPAEFPRRVADRRGRS